MPETLRARTIVTMDDDRPRATHVAVSGGEILAVGDADDAARWGHAIDDRYADCVLMPGFVEAHGHLAAGGIWDYVYVGAHDRVAPEGPVVPGLRSNAAIVERLRGAAARGEAVIGWGLDPIFIDGPRLSRHDLDRVADNRPVAVLHSNMHLMTVNTAALTLVGYGAESPVIGLVKSDDGEPTGELREFAAMFPLMRRLSLDFSSMANSSRALDRYGRLATRAGATTITDLLNDLPDDTIGMLRGYTRSDDCPVRMACALNALGGRPEDVRARARALATQSEARLRLGSAKIMTDGSIQAFTAQLRPPGYYGGTPDPMWNIAPEQLDRLVDVLHAGGVQMHIHTNGDLASEVAIAALEAAVARHPRRDHRHTLQHFQMADADQIRRLAAIGGGANLFANHLYYFGEQHATLTLGPERAARINPCATALANGLPLAIHSDTPVTPLAPLFTASCAANRVTEAGRVLGEDERIPPAAALRAITLGAAWTLGMDHEIGSITPGKLADFAVLDDDPLEPAGAGMAGVGIVGTVCTGRHYPA